ncbi:sialate O-acetylesterase [Rubricoccus marinus]|uniref:Sialate O-acetylesterase domain-containing protein n=1 Tax=Rubricoccus marinus TaxID=716817 RepID=A0A259TWQ0_9BACT|nr:sialate O-acetylesterase [Rubricoccus marinus]OZC02185.1 hypothetical protein BSZ36_03785 [Rubricoccus marinus]
MTISSAGTIRTLSNVYVGDVWFAAGQSNMEWRVIESDGGAAEAQRANDPMLRQFYVPKSFSPTPSDQLASGSGWTGATNPTDTGNFSAVAYYAAKDLRAELNVPIGIIYAAFGGGQIEEWMSLGMIAGRGVPTRREHAGAWNKMVHPLLPLPIKGVAWYQGESNSLRGMTPNYYGDLLISMVEGWRADFGQENMPFAWVQLPNIGEPFTSVTNARPPGDTPLATIRAQQDRALVLPHTGQVVTYDTGYPDADGRVNIHPTNKRPVGERLALVLRNIAYGESLQASGPRAISAQLGGGGAVVVSFKEVGAGLVVADGVLNGFTLAGPDGRYEWADAVIAGDRVVVSSSLVLDPRTVRYAWQTNPGNPGEPGTADLRNRDGLPAAPFEVDAATETDRRLAGAYSVYGAGADYTTLSDAVSDLNAYGVRGSVRLELQAGTHAERVRIGVVAGASATNRITLTAASGAAVTLAPEASAAGEDYVVRLSSAEYVTLSGLMLAPAGTAFENAVVLDGSLTGVSIENNTLVADGTGSGRVAIGSAPSLRATDLSIRGNTISGYSTAIHLEGDGAAIPQGVELVGNSVTNGAVGVRLWRLGAPDIRSNDITVRDSGFVASTLLGETRFESNVVSAGLAGVFITGSDGAPGARPLAANNMVLTQAGGSSAMRFVQSDNWQIWHNTLSAGGGVAATALGLDGGEGLSVFNNILSSRGTGTAMHVTAAPLTGFESDFNALSSNGATIGRVDLTDYTTLEAFVDALDTFNAATVSDANTRRASAVFADTVAVNLRIVGESVGDPLLSVPQLPTVLTDIDGDARGATTYAGADDAGVPFFNRVVLHGPAGWRMLSLPYPDLGLGGDDPAAGGGPGGAVTPGLLQPIYTAGYPGADIDEDGSGGYTNVFVRDETETSGVPNAEYSAPTSNFLAPGQGFWYYMFQDEDPFTNGEQGTFPKVLPASGTPLTSDYTFPVTFTRDSPIPGANLLGNPYDQGLNWDAPGWTRSRVITTAYVYDPYLGEFGDYRQWTVGVGGTMKDGVIPVGQGFFTYSTGNPAQLTAPASARTGFWNPAYVLDAPRPSGAESASKNGVAPEALPHVRFNMTGQIAGREHTAFAAIAIAEDAELGFDIRDAYALEPASGGNALRLAAALPGAEAGSPGLSVSTVPGAAEVALLAEAFASGAPTGATTRLAWEPTGLDGWIATLRDRVTGESYSLSESGEIALVLDGSSSLMPIAAGAEAASKSANSGGLPAAQFLRLATPGGERFVVSLSRVNTAGEASGERVLTLGAPMPNPTRGALRVPFSLDAAQEATVAVYDALGRRVAVLADGPLAAGAHDLTLETSSLAPGLYIVRLSATDTVLTRRFTVIR